MSPARLAVLAGYAALGPITGPLVAGVVRNIAKGDRILAGLYAAAIPATYFALIGIAGALAIQVAAAA